MAKWRDHVPDEPMVRVLPVRSIKERLAEIEHDPPPVDESSDKRA